MHHNADFHSGMQFKILILDIQENFDTKVTAVELQPPPSV